MRLLGPGGQGSAADHDENGHAALGDIQQLRLQCGESKTLDDDVGEDTQAADDQGAAYLEKDVAPGERVFQCFDKLVLFVDLVLDTRLVGTHALDHEALVLLRVTLCLHRAVGEDEGHDHRPSARGESQDEEEELPRLDGMANVMLGSPC